MASTVISMVDLSQPLDEAVAATIDELQGLFSKPKLSKKLLKRPPFAYVRAVVLAAFEATAVGAGLFTAEEAGEDAAAEAAEGGPSKSVKIRFLVKLIAWAANASGERLDVFVSPAKVVSGQEPVATNALLRCVGRVVKGEFDGAVGTMAPDAAVAVVSAGRWGSTSAPSWCGPPSSSARPSCAPRSTSASA